MKARYTARVRGLDEIVWYDPEAITNILAMKMVRLHFCIECDCDAGNYSIIRDGLPNIDFVMTEDGLHVHSPYNDFSFVNTVLKTRRASASDS